MNKHTTLPNLMQKIVSDEDIQTITEAVGYHDSSRKFTVRTLIDFFLLAAVHEWKSFRHGADVAPTYQLRRFHYSFAENGQLFVIRMKENVEIHRRHRLQRLVSSDSNVIVDFTCQLGTKQCRSKKRHRVVIFRDAHGKEIRVVTNIFDVSAEKIADMYQERWAVEVFFRWIKQYLNVPTLFGTTKNAVYNQLFAAFIAYV